MSRPKIKKNTFWYLLALIALGLGFYFIYRYTLFLDDDYLYALFSGTDRLITSVKDALHSQAIEYMEHNGRFVIHTIVHLFCGVWGLSLFSLINTLMFVLFFVITLKLALNNKDKLFLKGFILLLFIWFFIPVPGVTFLGNIAFSVNYLWASVATFGFLLIYTKSKAETKGWWQSFLLLAFGIFVGSLQESFSVGIAGSFFIFYCFHFKELRGRRLFLVLGYIVGTIIIVGAPGNFARMEGEQTGVWDSGLKMLLLIKWSQFRQMFFGLPILDLLLVTIVLMFIRNANNAWNFIKKYQLYLVAILVNLLFSLVVAFKGQWQITSSALLAILILANLVFEELDKQPGKHRILIFCTGAVLLISTYIPALNIRKLLYQEHQALMESARTSKKGLAWGNYEVMGRAFQKKYHFLENYFRVVFYMGDIYHKHLLSVYLSKGTNPNFVTCVLPFSPEKIESFCISENQLSPTFQIYKAGDYPFIILIAKDELKMQENRVALDIILDKPSQNQPIKGLIREDYRYNEMNYEVIYLK